MINRTLIAAALLLTATTAQANWTAFFEPKNTDGRPMCGMRYTDDRGSIMVKYVLGTPRESDEQVFVQFLSREWTIRYGAMVPFYLLFDAQPYGETNAWGGSTPDGNGGRTGLIAFYIANAPRFLERFSNAGRMTFGFKSTVAAPWTADLTGSRDAATEFAKCTSVPPS